MDKKKKPQKLSDEIEEISANGGSSNDQPKFVTEVVEEVGNDEVAPEKSVEEKEIISEEIIPDEEVKEEVESRFANVKDDKKETVAPPLGSEINKRQMVEDIYSPRKTNSLVDITINKKRTNQPAIVWAIIIIAVALMTGGGMILLTKNTGEKVANVTPTPTVAQTITPSPVPIEIKREDLNIQVLNGGGKAGAGSKMKTLLTDLGYVVSDVGNTEEYTFEKTEIEVKTGKEGALELLRNDLAKDYSLGTMSATLASDSPYDVRVTVGK